MFVGERSTAPSSRERSTTGSARTSGLLRSSSSHPETGNASITAVHRRDELFHGPELEKIPDLIFEFAGYAWAGKGNLMKRTPTIWDTIKMAESGNEVYVGTHRHEGIVAFTGPSAAREGR